MSNDPRDDAMREIEAALQHYFEEWEWAEFDDDDGEAAGEAKAKALALIRSKLPQPDAEHERAVEAWRGAVAACRMDGLRTETGWSVYGMPYVVIDDALRLMRARPATCKDGLQVDELLKLAAKMGDAPLTMTEVLYRQEEDRMLARSKAAGETLRTAKAAIIKEADNADEGYSAGLHRAAEILDEASRRARPATGKDEAAEERAEAAENLLAAYFQRDDEKRKKQMAKDEAAVEMLRAAKVAREYVGPSKDYDDLCNAIAKAERAGIKP